MSCDHANMQNITKCKQKLPFNDLITTLHYKNTDANSILTLESGDPRMHLDVYSQYVFQEPSKACRLSEPAHNIGG